MKASFYKKQKNIFFMQHLCNRINKGAEEADIGALTLQSSCPAFSRPSRRFISNRKDVLTRLAGKRD
jgi:hypothetical protein